MIAPWDISGSYWRQVMFHRFDMNGLSRPRKSLARACCIGLCTTLLALQPLRAARAAEITGLLDMRLTATDTRHSWLRGGLDKGRLDGSAGGLRLGGAFLKIEADVLDVVTGTAVLSAQDDRSGGVDVNEAFLSWNPVPTSPWRSRWRAGAFFPVTSLEIDYDSIGWTPRDTISSSAINSWIGEELRTVGLEYRVSRNGRQAGSKHDWGFTAAVFGANDPAGSVMAWRGWSLSDRITGLRETIPLANLPALAPGGPLAAQTRSVNVFRELDQRLGFYVSADYAYAGWFEAAAMRYDNRGDPMVISSGQYAWLTRFNHLSARLRQVGAWDLAGQALQGDTLMGPGAVYVDFNAWFLLASRPLGPGRFAIRYDQFSTSEREQDILAADPNGEHGHALALAYHWAIKPQLALVTEWLTIRSDRPARLSAGDPAVRHEQSLTASLRVRF